MQASHIPSASASTSGENEEKKDQPIEDMDRPVLLTFKVGDLICPIGQFFMLVPRITNCGHHFEKDQIETAKATKPECPCCRKTITSLSPSPGMERMLTAFYGQLKHQSEKVKEFLPDEFDMVVHLFDHEDREVKKEIRNMIVSRPDILNKEGAINNTIYSIAFFVAGRTEGRRFLMEKNLYHHVSEKILNRIITTGEHQGESLAYLLCSPNNDMIITLGLIPLSTILPATFNALSENVNRPGLSIAFWLSLYAIFNNTAKNILASLIHHLSAETLNRPTTENASVASNLACSDSGLDMLIERVSQITSATLNRIITTNILQKTGTFNDYLKGTSLAFLLVKTEKGLNAFAEAKFIDQITEHTLNAKIPEGEDAGKSIASCLIHSVKGRDLLNQHPRVKKMLSAENVKLLQDTEQALQSIEKLLRISIEPPLQNRRQPFEPEVKDTPMRSSTCKTLGKRICGFFHGTAEDESERPIKRQRTDSVAALARRGM